MTLSNGFAIMCFPVLVRAGVETQSEATISNQVKNMFVRKYKGTGPILQVASSLSLIRHWAGREGGTPRVTTGFRTGGSGLCRFESAYDREAMGIAQGFPFFVRWLEQRTRHDDD